MRKSLMILGILLVLCAAAYAEVNVQIGINIPPIVISSPPELYPVPGLYVYFAPGVEADIFFYQGYWWRPYDGRWHRADNYNGPWNYIVIDRVPRPLMSVPPDFRRVPPGLSKIPYGQVKKNWKSWEREKRWEHPDAKGEKRGGDNKMERKGRGRGR